MKRNLCFTVCALYLVFLLSSILPVIAVKSDSGRSLSAEILGEGAVLLQNNNNVLPLPKGEQIALFGNAQIDYLVGGGGSSVMFTDDTVNPVEGLKKAAEKGKIKIYEPLLDAYAAHVGECQGLKAIWGTDAFYEKNEKKSYEMNVTRAQWDQAAENAETAVLFLSRYATEGADMKAEKGGYYLSDAEASLLREMTARFEKTVVILNIPAAMDLSQFAGGAGQYDVDAVLAAWYSGEEAGSVIASLLCGDINPSGKLTATFAKDYGDYYSSKNWTNNNVVQYEEDIFVGYRQFSTFNPDRVLFGFGYGLSYTSFAIEEYKIQEEDGNITAAIRVANTGKRAGKEVLQVYFKAPQGVLGKPAAELAGYAKTPLLKPGETASVYITFPVSDMSSYDDAGKIQKSAYLMESGDYGVYIGNSLSDAIRRDPVYTYTLNETKIMEQLSERAPSSRLKKRLLSDGTYEELQRRTPERNEQQIEGYVNNAAAPDKPVSLAALYRDMSLMDAFLAQLSIEQMAELAGGQPGGRIGAAAGAFSGNILSEYGGINLYMTDGCHGVRVNSLATYYPSGTCLASTYNTELAERYGAEIGIECQQSGIDIWLGPGMNIIRNPLCGRNFEYYSEDPIVTGKTAAAVTRGVQRHHIAVSLKHYAANNKETNRGPCDSEVSERALREIYLKGFEICVKEADPWTIMTTCGTVNATGAAGNYDLMTAIPRNEWGWSGVFLSDWANMDDEVAELKAGHNLGMPKNTYTVLTNAFKTGKITRPQLEENSKYLIALILKLHSFKRTADPQYRGTVYATHAGETSLRLAGYSSCTPYSEAQYDANGFLIDCKKGSSFTYYIECSDVLYSDMVLLFGKDSTGKVTAAIDGKKIGTFHTAEMKSAAGGQIASQPAAVTLTKGVHQITLTVDDGIFQFSRLQMESKKADSVLIYSLCIVLVLACPILLKKWIQSASSSAA